MVSLKLEVDDVHAVLIKVMAIARMNEIRIVHISYDASAHASDGGSINLRLEAERALGIDRLIARSGEIVGVSDCRAEAHGAWPDAAAERRAVGAGRSFRQ